MLPLTGKTVLITGASSGIGYATARLLKENGANLILCARRTEKLAELTSHLFELDVRNKHHVEKQLSQLDNVDILINNAGLARGLDNFQEADISDWEEMIDTNLKGLLYVTKMIVPKMIEKKSGHIVNIGSIAGREVYPKGNVYCATKAAVHSLHHALRMDLLGTAIRVSLISPGMVDTEFSSVRFKGDSARAKLTYHGMEPLHAEDIASAILYCVTAPNHVNISEVHLTPTAQASATLIDRKSLA